MKKPDREKLLAANPEIAAELESFLGNAAQFHQFAEPAPESPIPLPLIGNSPVEVGTPTPGIPSDQPTMVFPQRGVSSSRNVLRYFGDYELIEEIARGGMGVVYKARQVTLNRIVAVKMILGGQLAGPEDVQRFHTEAEAAAKLDHPGIVPIYEVGQRDGQHFFSMGFVEGQSLAKRVAEGPLEPREAAELVKTISEAVQYAHDKGVIHRDLKPGNILLDTRGRPRVTDFGLAKLSESGSDLTGTGQILGTPSYMPPEQAAAQVSAVGRLSDVYSLGAILYCLLTGRPPFQAANPLETLLQVQKQEPLAPRQLNPTIPLDLNTIVLKCLDKAPSRRYASAKALVEELNRYLEGRPILARPVSRRERVWRWCRRNPVVAGLTTAVAVSVIVGTSVTLSIRANADIRRQQYTAVSLVQRLSSTDAVFVPGIIKQMDGYRHYADPLLRNEFATSPEGSQQKLHASLALLPVDPTQVEYLYERLLNAQPKEVVVIREALMGYKADLTQRLWKLLENPQNDQDQRFRAACTLSAFAPDDPRWENVSGDVAAMLVVQKPFVIAQWTDALQGVCRPLIPQLADFLADEKRSVSERGLIATVYGRFAADMPNAYALLEQRLAEFADSNATVEQKVYSVRKQASIGLALLIMGRGERIWPLLKHSPDPTLRSYLVEWMEPFGVHPKSLLARLDEESEVSIKRAILLSLGQYGPDHLSVDMRLNLLPHLLDVYENNPDSGIHAAAEWMLQQWGKRETLNSLDATLCTDESQLQNVLFGQLTNEQTQRFSRLSSNIEQLQNKVADCERTLPLRQMIWERKRLEQSTLPNSLKEGLVTHYPFDEAEGFSTANTVSGQPNGAYQGPRKPDRVQGVLGRAFKLDGEGTVVGGSPLDLESDHPLSYGCWFQYNQQTPMILLSSKDRTKGYRGFDVSLENDHQLRMQIAGEDPPLPHATRQEYTPTLLSVITTTNVAPKHLPGWHHVMITYDGSQKAKGVRIFVDGQPKPTHILEDKLAGTIKSNAPLHVGSRHDTYRFRGLIDDVQVYNRRLTELEVEQVFESGIQALIRIASNERTPEQQQLLAMSFRLHDDLLRSSAAQLEEVRMSLEAAQRKWEWGRRWYLNRHGQTMVVVPKPGEFWMGEGQERHRDRVDHNFAISAKEVTVEQFLRFFKEHHYQMEYSPKGDCPMNTITWYDAVAYCNWLSEKELIPKGQWCYEPNKDGRYQAGMATASNFLERTG